MCPDGVTSGLVDINGVLVLLTELLELLESLDVELDDGKGDSETVLLTIAEGDWVMCPDRVTSGLEDINGVLLIEPLVEPLDVELDEVDPEIVLLLVTVDE